MCLVEEVFAEINTYDLITKKKLAQILCRLEYFGISGTNTNHKKIDMNQKKFVFEFWECSICTMGDWSYPASIHVFGNIGSPPI